MKTASIGESSPTTAGNAGNISVSPVSVAAEASSRDQVPRSPSSSSSELISRMGQRTLPGTEWISSPDALASCAAWSSTPPALSIRLSFQTITGAAIPSPIAFAEGPNSLSKSQTPPLLTPRIVAATGSIWINRIDGRTSVCSFVRSNARLPQRRHQCSHAPPSAASRAMPRAQSRENVQWAPT